MARSRTNLFAVQRDGLAEEEYQLRKEIDLADKYAQMERGDAFQDLKKELLSWIEDNRNTYELSDVTREQFLDLRGFVRGLRKVLDEVQTKLNIREEASQRLKEITSSRGE